MPISPSPGHLLRIYSEVSSICPFAHQTSPSRDGWRSLNFDIQVRVSSFLFVLVPDGCHSWHMAHRDCERQHPVPRSQCVLNLPPLTQRPTVSVVTPNQTPPTGPFPIRPVFHDKTEIATIVFSVLIKDLQMHSEKFHSPDMRPCTSIAHCRMLLNHIPAARHTRALFFPELDDSGIAPERGPATPPFHADPDNRLITTRIATNTDETTKLTQHTSTLLGQHPNPPQ